MTPELCIILYADEQENNPDVSQRHRSVCVLSTRLVQLENR